MKNMTRLFLFMTWASVGMVHTGYAADATSFNPLAVSVEAQAISGVPVGTIITWPVAGNPEGWAEGNWLECNGQTISPTVYPELCALIGGRVPDLRGLFLRGSGGQSAPLGVMQADAARTPAATTSYFWTLVMPGRREDAGGVFSYGAMEMAHEYGGGGFYLYHPVYMDLSKLWPSNTSTEFRPVNISVRYLIRARA